LIKERVQKAGKPGIAYAVEKSRLLDLSPHVLTSAQKVSYLIGGLANWQHVVAMMNDTLADVDELMTRLRNLETLFSTLRPNVSTFPPNNPFFQPSTLPPVPMYPPPALTPLPSAAPPLSMGNQITGLTERLNGLTLGGARAKCSTSQIIVVAFSVERSDTSREIVLVARETAWPRRLA
jgi:hypothetical protein